MRTLSEIIDLAQDGGMPTFEECYWAMLALNALNNMNMKRVMDIYSARDKPSLKMCAELKWKGSFEANKAAMNVTPQHYLGPTHDPANPECQKFRKFSKSVLNHVLSQPNNPS